MKKHTRLTALLLCLLMLLTLSPAAFASEERTERYDSGVIVGFAPLGDAATVDTPIKLDMIELEKLFPARLELLLGGTVLYAGDTIVSVEPEKTESAELPWLCREDYDEALDVFHFTPALEGYALADGAALPVITVYVGAEPELPELSALPYMEEEEVPIVGALPRRRAAMPAYYNNFERGVLPPVRDQGAYGSCWSFATIGSVEADLIQDGMAGTGIDLSELHLVYYAFHPYLDEKDCNVGDTIALNGAQPLNVGGNGQMASRVLANMAGPVREEAAPYSLGTAYDPGPASGRGENCGIQLTGSYAVNSGDRDAIKQNIMQHGGVIGSMYMDNSCYSATHSSYYYSGSTGVNHAIMLVGWDDSFPGEYFRNASGLGDGAWLVRNSWGKTAYDRQGYFWMSYECGSVGTSVYAVDARDWQYDHCYAYDSIPLNRSSYNPTGGSATASMGFTVSGGEVISAVGVETGTAELTVAVTVSCGEQTAAQTIYTTYPGYYLIPLDETVTVDEESRATVDVSFTGNSDKIKIPVESTVSYESVDFTAGCGSGGVVINGSVKPYDGRIKLFTLNGEGAAPTITEQPLSRTEAVVGETVRFTVAAKGPKLRYQWQKLVDETWTDVPDGNRAVLAIVPSAPVTAEKYSCLITNDWGEARSQTVELTAVYPSHGTWGGLSWTLDTAGKLTISGTGGMTGFESGDTMDAWRVCKSVIRTAELASGVTGIGAYAFSGCESLTDVTIPASVTDIGESAFSGCTGLSGIWYGGADLQWQTIAVGPDNGPLSDAALHGVEPDLVLPASLTEIGEEAFAGGAFTYVTLSENTVLIGPYAFADCRNLAYIRIPAEEAYIDENAFGSVTGLTVIGAPNGSAEAYARAHSFAFVATAAPSEPDE